MLHGLLQLKVGEECEVLTEIETDFDAECLGLYVPTRMHLKQHVHMNDEGTSVFLSPNVG